VSSLDHATGKERLDLKHAWTDPSPPRVQWLSPEEQAAGFWPSNLVFHQPDGASASARAEDNTGKPRFFVVGLWNYVIPPPHGGGVVLCKMQASTPLSWNSTCRRFGRRRCVWTCRRGLES